MLAEAVAAGPAAFLEASSDMSMKSRKPNEVDEDELEQSRRDAPQKPYRLSPGAGSERRGSGGLLSRTAVHAVGGME